MNPRDRQHSAPVEMVPYDSSWPSKFEAERRLLEDLLAPWIIASIEHIGSTSVVGLSAKPVIDMMGPVESLRASRDAIDSAPKAGYVYWPYKADIMHWFCKPSDAYRTHHLHLVPKGSNLWRDRLLFRDLLRDDSRLAGQYAALKYEMARRHRDDREAYTSAKTEFVNQVLKTHR